MKCPECKGENLVQDSGGFYCQDCRTYFTRTMIRTAETIDTLTKELDLFQDAFCLAIDRAQLAEEENAALKEVK